MEESQSSKFPKLFYRNIFQVCFFFNFFKFVLFSVCLSRDGHIHIKKHIKNWVIIRSTKMGYLMLVDKIQVG